MPQRSRTARIHYVTSTLLIACIRDALANLRTTRPDVDVVDLLICTAAFVGFYERKPMSHNKLAAFTGIPRPTVVRRVKKLVDCRLLEEAEDGKSIVTPTYRLSRDETKRLSAKHAMHIQNAAAALSKVDNE